MVCLGSGINTTAAVSLMQVHRDAVGDKAFEGLHKQQQERLQQAAAKAAQVAVAGADDAGTTGKATDAGQGLGAASNPGVPHSLLEELKVVGMSNPKQPVGAAAAAGKEAAVAKKKPLIEELD